MRVKFDVKLHESRTLTWWRRRADQIDMSPSYQRRGRLWSEADKAFLIDSILNGFDIPKIYLADFNYGNSPLNQSKLPYSIIDGKQRFETILDFFKGELTLNKEFVYLKDPSLELGGLGYTDLQKNYPSVAEDFDNFNLHVMSVISDSEELINDLFIRLNRSKPLTGAEIRNAMGGPVPEMIREITLHEFFKNIVRFSVTRGQDKNAAAKLLLFEYYTQPRETKKRNLDDFVKNASNFKETERERLELAGRKVVDTLDVMEEVFLPKDKLLSSAGIIPVYYWLVRSLGRDELRQVRAFLVKFEEDRQMNRQEVTENPTSKQVDPQLVEFETHSRSTNDQASHKRRFEILRERLEAES